MTLSGSERLRFGCACRFAEIIWLPTAKLEPHLPDDALPYPDARAFGFRLGQELHAGLLERLLNPHADLQPDWLACLEVRLLAPRILERLYLETGHDRRWAAPLDEQELNALGQAWGGGSIRRLERLVEGLIEIRERERPRQ